MNILAIESSSQILSVALGLGGKILCQFKSSKRFKSEHIIGLIKKALNKAKLALGDLDYIAVGLGPGSFTGLRVGLASAKALALAAKIKIIGIPSLDCIAANVRDWQGKDICTIVDARRDNLYTAIFRKTVNHSKFSLRKKLTYTLLGYSQLLDKIDAPVVFAGDGLLKFKELIKLAKPDYAFFAPQAQWYPDAKALVELALSSTNQASNKTKNILPIYLYPKECQIRDERTNERKSIKI